MDEEIKEEILDSPLVVHKKSDASYKEASPEIGMQTTHVDEDSDAPTLERHRFKKEKKKSKAPYVLIAVLIIAVTVVAVLYNNGTIKLPEKTTQESTKKSYTTQEVNPFADIVTIKGNYIFFEGTELDDIGELERKIKYLDSGKAFTIQDEHADSTFLNNEVLPLFTKYDMNYEVVYIASSGLVSKYETTAASSTQPPQTQSEAQSASESSEAAQ